MRCSEGLASSFGPSSLSSIGVTAGLRSRAASGVPAQRRRHPCAFPQASFTRARLRLAGGDDRSSDAPAQRQKIATILISHRLIDVFAVCDRVVALRHGRVVMTCPH